MKWVIIAACIIAVVFIALFALAVIGTHEILKGASCRDRAIMRGLRNDKTVDNESVEGRKAQR